MSSYKYGKKDKKLNRQFVRSYKKSGYYSPALAKRLKLRLKE